MRLDSTPGTRPHDWASLAMLSTAMVAIIGLLYGGLGWAALGLAATVALGVAARRSSRGAPGPMPHAMRWVLFLPRGTHSPEHLQRILAPRPGERILEVGPGIGVHAIPVAGTLAPEGRLDALDVQAAMLRDLEDRATRAGLTNIVGRQGEAERLPYSDQVFDAAYLIGVLGEIPDIPAALRELRRVLKPDGRLVVGEMVLDPDYVSPATLARFAEQAGLRLERRQGPWLAYFARFVPHGTIEPASHTPRSATRPA